MQNRNAVNIAMCELEVFLKVMEGVFWYKCRTKCRTKDFE